MTSSAQKDFKLSDNAILKLTEEDMKRIRSLSSVANAPTTMPAFDKANIPDHIRQLERAFKDYDITSDSKKKQHLAEYNVSSFFGYNIRCNIESLGSFSDDKVSWDEFKALVKEEYKAYDLARWKDSISFLYDLSNK
ncbi:hypothetical protein MBM_02808 [Drepanopeziza brunnea f. sp. 'multigermtubi' MB_m1]|uniref:Uncharacterized protein n=1 Tax=Marssonina brunnea f. sp. multigermtubi (strain MB_m1) TaxID=1072389 RepID=K1X2Y4_MARBU|nr:uncharacterized protein MBM_02808 [Drepanopeziza brunnea f. sp. 'multigermtubi' MB_m1]EKD19571.1 hypothetical protein MBM_02808 [Drepanopeziza brunnea f. sp. 'multigermtubi' MB_m1]